jgi:hypothetical protein
MIWNVMGLLPQALEIIFEVQRKGIKYKKINKLSNLQNTFFSFFFIFGPLLFSNLITFFLFTLNNLKCYRSVIRSSTNDFNSNINKTTYKDFFGCLGTNLCNVPWFFFWVLNPLYFGGPLLSQFFFFLTILMC